MFNLISPLIKRIGFRWSSQSCGTQTEFGFNVTSQFLIDEPLRSSGDPRARPAYQVMDFNGRLVEGVAEDDTARSKEDAVQMYQQMVTIAEMDKIGYDVQRQGRISFYMTQFGEEATVIGSGHGLRPQDLVYAQYREGGLFLVRGWTLDNFMNQLYSNALDLGKGRQMPIHYGARDLNIHTISSPLTTQVPQAAGAAYALKMRPGNDAIAACYFGEGAASEGDFHAGMNFAQTRRCPVLFVCRNNGYAISTPTCDQFGGDGIVARAAGYGMKSVRVDGNDVWAVREAVRRAREEIARTSEPVLLETMSYRVGHHSTSDDSTRYRGSDEIAHWTASNNPILRLKKYMLDRQWWDEAADAALVKDTRKQVLAALKRAEVQKKPPIKDLFTDVYKDLPPHLQQQQAALDEHLKKYGEHYSLEDYAQ